MPTTPTNNCAVKQLSEHIQHLEALLNEIKAQLPTQVNASVKDLAIEVEQELTKIEKEVLRAKQELEANTKAVDLLEREVLELLEKGEENPANPPKEEAECIAIEDATQKDPNSTPQPKTDTKDEAASNLAPSKDTQATENSTTPEEAEQKKQALIKEATEGMTEGGFEELLEVKEDGTVDVIESKRDELIVSLINIIASKLVDYIEARLKKEIDGLIDKAVEEAIKITGAEWTAKLVATVTKRIFRKSLNILKSEIKYLLSKKTLDTLLDIVKESAAQTLQNGLQDRKIKDVLKEFFTYAKTHPEFKKIVRGVRRRLARKFLAMAKEEVKAVAVEVIDAFLRVHGEWSGTLISMKRQTANFPLFTGVSAHASFSASIGASLAGKRQGVGASVCGKVKGKGFLGIGITIGYDIPVWGNLSIKGGIEGGPSLTASINISVEAKNSIIHADITPISINAALEARFYLETPIPNRILKYVPAYVKKATVSGHTIYYPLGKPVNLLVIKTPKYAMTFDVSKKKYVYQGASGSYSIYIHPNVKAIVKSITDAIENAVDEVLSYVDPTRIDLNPFDSDGYFSSWFN